MWCTLSVRGVCILCLALWGVGRGRGRHGLPVQLPVGTAHGKPAQTLKQGHETKHVTTIATGNIVTHPHHLTSKWRLLTGVNTDFASGHYPGLGHVVRDLLSGRKGLDQADLQL